MISVWTHSTTGVAEATWRLPPVSSRPVSTGWRKRRLPPHPPGPAGPCGGV